MLIQFNAAPKRIEPKKRAWSHLKAFKKIFQMRLSSFLWLNLFRRSIKLNQHGLCRYILNTCYAPLLVGVEKPVETFMVSSLFGR